MSNPAAMGGIVPGAIEVQVSASGGDGECGDGSPATPTITGAYVECRSNTSIFHRRLGWVWQNCAIPKGAPISSAIVRAHHINSVAYRDQYGTLYGHASDNSPLIQAVLDDLIRPQTTANVSWIATLAGNAWNDSPDISTIIQEIVDRPGWASGNGICIMNIPSHVVNYQARYDAWDGLPANAAKLIVSWG